MVHLWKQPQPRWVGAVTSSRFPSKQQPAHKATLVPCQTHVKWHAVSSIKFLKNSIVRLWDVTPRQGRGSAGIYFHDRDPVRHEGLRGFIPRQWHLTMSWCFSMQYNTRLGRHCSAGCSMARQPLIQSPTTWHFCKS
jgi:hypothetical protein